jgi:hypothetical protein
VVDTIKAIEKSTRGLSNTRWWSLKIVAGTEYYDIPIMTFK